MFNTLSDRLERSFKILKGEGRITEINIAETMKDVRRALLDADVNYKVAKTFTDTVKSKALGQNVINSLKPKELMVKIVHDELTQLMVAGDVYRPAAIEQLKVVGEQVGVPVYTEEGNRNPVEIARNAIAQAKGRYDLVIVDTAGRLAVDEAMMDEIEAIKNAIKPQETLFVVDAMTGQDAVNTAKAFNDRLDFDGVVLTKLDGDTRGGAALSIRSVVEKPIKFVGTGEKLEDIQEFNPEGMASRILGMGDIVELAKRAQEVYDQKEAERLQEKIRKNKFDFEDFMHQIQQIKKMGDLKGLASMIPGVGKAIKDIDIDNDAFKGIEAIINSMTPDERHNPEIINTSRRQRIAKGSGSTLQDVNRLLKQFEETRKMMRMATNMKNPMKLMKQMKGRGGMPGMPGMKR